MLALVTATAVAAPARDARADDEPPEHLDYHAHIGGTIGAFAIDTPWGQGVLDGGLRLPQWPVLWAHAELVTGFLGGDQVDRDWNGALVGLELRSSGRWVRGVAGLDLGVGWLRRKVEDELDEQGAALLWSWHLYLELGSFVVFRLGFDGLAYSQAPTPAVGLALRW